MLAEVGFSKRKLNLLSVSVSVALALWAALFVCSLLKNPGVAAISVLAAKIEFGVQILILWLLLGIYKTRQKVAEKSTLLWLLILNAWLLFTDVCYYIAAYLDGSLLKSLSFIEFLLYYVPAIVYCAFMIISISRILLRNILNRKTFIKAVSALLIMNVVTMVLFLSSIHYAFAVMSWQTISQIILLSAQLILFDFAILSLMYADSAPAKWFLSGVLVLGSSDFFLTYSYMSQTTQLYSYGELLWLLALILLYISIVSMQKNESYNINTWFRKNSTIKSQLTFSTFIISSSCFLLFFVLAYVFSIIDKTVFLGLPLFIIIYSVMVVILSLCIGAAFEAPFKKLKNNIALLMGNDANAKLDASFSIDEFIVLQDFFVQMFKLNNERNIMAQRLNQIATDAAHDIRAPIAVLNTCLEYLPSIPEQDRSLMRTATGRINAIANSLLNEFREQGRQENIASNVRVVSLISLLHSILREKKAQFSAEAVNINLDLKQADLSYFAMINFEEMKRVLSNLINNAVESFIDNQGTIHISLNGDENNVTITIEDNGCGIAEQDQERVLQRGVSLKENGTGIGLYHAKKTIESWQGTLSLSSVEKEGTRVTLQLPRQLTPSWFIDQIPLSLSTPIAILDDDVSVHRAWQLKLEAVSKDLALNFFTESHAFLEWAEQQPDFFLLTDYSLGNKKLTGLDIIERLQLKKKAILSTGQYDQAEIINRCQQLGCYLLPKNLMYYISVSTYG